MEEMGEKRQGNDDMLSPHVQLIQMGTAFWMSRVLYAAAKLELADRIDDGAMTVPEIAAAAAVHPRSLYRLMRTLAGMGLLAEDGEQRFRLTALGKGLKKDAPGAARSTILAMGCKWFWRAWEEFPWSVETSNTGMEKAWGKPAFDVLAEHPEDAAYFNEAMIGVHGSEPPAVAAAYDFSLFGMVVDVGGGTGNLLASILERHPEPRGILFDLPHVADAAREAIRRRGLAERISVESGNFFQSVPESGDVYMLSHVIHDWSVEKATAILRNCRARMRDDGRLLLIEMVLPGENIPHPGKLLDMVMLALPGGEERTGDEYAALLAGAGFGLTRVIPTDSAVSIIEAVPN